MRRNQIDFVPFHPLLRKTRKRIETLFSQLCDQFMIRRNYAKSFQGLATRVMSKLTALTLIQWLNQRNGNNLNNLKSPSPKCTTGNVCIIADLCAN